MVLPQAPADLVVPHRQAPEEQEQERRQRCEERLARKAARQLNQKDDIIRNNTVFYDGNHYATLDFWPPDSELLGTQGGFQEVPTGWELAPNDPKVVENVIGKHPWGTHIMMVGEGLGYSTLLLTAQGYEAGQLWQGVRLVRHKNQYAPDFSPGRVLIRTPNPQWQASNYCLDLNERLWQERRFTDCEVVCNGEAMPCHRCVLAMASPVFDRMLDSGMKEAEQHRIVVSDSEPSVVKAMLDFAYTGVLAEETGDIDAILRLADYYQIEKLVALCADRAVESVNHSNVVAVVRAFRSLRHRPDMKQRWSRLMERLRSDDKLLEVAMDYM
jgi:hypothetical protein